LIRKVQTYIETNHLLTPGKPVIIGFSGGRDSVSLLFILNRLGYKCITVHCNFHLRGDESDRDEAFCKKFAEEHNIIFEKIDFDTKSYAEMHHISIEMAARDLRYDLFEKIRIKYDAQAVAVAHHRDDSNETMLLNMIRGTGIRGLCGIQSKNGYIVRPLLCVDKDELNRFIEEQKLPFVTDSSNLTDEYTRNFIRLRLIPLMEEINPSVGTTLARTADHLSDTEKIYSHSIEQIIGQLLKEKKHDEYQISIKNLLIQPAPKTILYELLKHFDFTRDISENIFRSLTGEPGKKFFSNKSSYILLKDRDFLFIYKQSEAICEVYEIDENVIYNNTLPVNIYMRKVEIKNDFNIDKSLSTATLDYDKLKFPLKLRKWQPGDWFIPFGMKGRKKLSDYFSDSKLSILEKEKTWVLCSGEDIVWIVGKRTDNRFRIDEKTKKTLVINFSGK